MSRRVKVTCDICGAEMAYGCHIEVVPFDVCCGGVRELDEDYQYYMVRHCERDICENCMEKFDRWVMQAQNKGADV